MLEAPIYAGIQNLLREKVIRRRTVKTDTGTFTPARSGLYLITLIGGGGGGNQFFSGGGGQTIWRYPALLVAGKPYAYTCGLGGVAGKAFGVPAWTIAPATPARSWGMGPTGTAVGNPLNSFIDADANGLAFMYGSAVYPMSFTTGIAAGVTSINKAGSVPYALFTQTKASATHDYPIGNLGSQATPTKSLRAAPYTQSVVGGSTYTNAASFTNVWVIGVLANGDMITIGQGTASAQGFLKWPVGGGAITIIAGCTTNSSGVDGTGTAATMTQVVSSRGWNNQYIAFDKTNGVIYWAEGYAVRKCVISTGEVTTLAGVVATAEVGTVDLPTDGTGPAARFGTIGSIALMANGDIYVAHILPKTNTPWLRKITSAGVVTTVCGSMASTAPTDGTSAVAKLSSTFTPAKDMIWSTNGKLYMTVSGGFGIREWDGTTMRTLLAYDNGAATARAIVKLSENADNTFFCIQGDVIGKLNITTLAWTVVLDMGALGWNIQPSPSTSSGPILGPLAPLSQAVGIAGGNSTFAGVPTALGGSAHITLSQTVTPPGGGGASDTGGTVTLSSATGVAGSSWGTAYCTGAAGSNTATNYTCDYRALPSGTACGGASWWGFGGVRVGNIPAGVGGGGWGMCTVADVQAQNGGDGLVIIEEI